VISRTILNGMWRVVGAGDGFGRVRRAGLRPEFSIFETALSHASAARRGTASAGLFMVLIEMDMRRHGWGDRRARPADRSIWSDPGALSCALSCRF
jgi:hypothetical protein